MGLWSTSVLICNSIREHGQPSVRHLAERIGLSKSSVQRHLQAIKRRDGSPESSLWEPEAGRAWLIRLVVATLCGFGLKRGVGAATLSAFFSRLRLEAQVGGSPRALRCVMHTLERLLLETATAWEKEGMAHGEIRPVIGAVAATCLHRMLLGCMDLATGYVVMEAVAADRSFDPCDGGRNKRLTPFGPEGLSVVSDRAKALGKLAHTGRGGLSIPALFPLRHALAKGYALTICGRLQQAARGLAQAKQRLEMLPQNPQGERVQSERAQALGAASATAVNHGQGGRRAWQEPLANGSRLLQPWRLADASRQTSTEVAEQVHAELQAMATLLETNGLPVKKGPLDKVGTQLAGVAALGDFWWQTVRQDLAPLAMPPRWPQGAEEGLLPRMYWQEQLQRPRRPGQKAQSALVLQAVEAAFARHPCTRRLTPEVLAGWKSWAGEQARAFQRASSAVEGRHGSLAQRQHNHRGLPTRRSQGWTVLHNCACRAADGTTPASRCFRRSFPDLFESV